LKKKNHNYGFNDQIEDKLKFDKRTKNQNKNKIKIKVEISVNERITLKF
jgi:hypothetical protein